MRYTDIVLCKGEGACNDLCNLTRDISYLTSSSVHRCLTRRPLLLLAVLLSHIPSSLHFKHQFLEDRANHRVESECWFVEGEGLECNDMIGCGTIRDR